ncbi:MAG: glycerol kinase GlpK [Pseudomonadota bacterium]
MADQPLILAIDQGTTSSRAILFDLKGAPVAMAAEEFPQIFPKPGWVEHDAEAIWRTSLATCRTVLADEALARRVAGIGITNQRETVVLWDAASGAPVANAIVWQDRRTADACAALREAGHEAMIQAKTGLLLDPYFSASKIAWLLDHRPGLRARAQAGKIKAGTIDCFLLWRLTGVHATDASNASRTMLYNLAIGDWDEGLLALFDIPRALLPEIRDSAGVFGETKAALLGRAIPVGAMIGDQQAALVGQGCFAPGMMKATYGTGCFALVNTGATATPSRNRLLTTVAYRLGGRDVFALEGSIFIAGALVQWLRDQLQLIEAAGASEALAKSVTDNGGVYVVPAFAGLGAPYWNPAARGAISGLTRGSGRAHIVRASLEAMAHQSHDLLAAMAADGATASRLRVDGGMAKNDWICQDLADILNIPIDRPAVTETTALGAAMLAALGIGLFKNLEDIAKTWRLERGFTPALDEAARATRLAGWRHAVAQVQAWT